MNPFEVFQLKNELAEVKKQALSLIQLLHRINDKLTSIIDDLEDVE